MANLEGAEASSVGLVEWARDDWRIAGSLWLSAFIIVCWFTHILPGTNDGSRYSLAVALGTNGSCEIGEIYDGLLGDSAIDKALVEGRFYCDKAPLGGFMAAPAVWLVAQVTDSLYVSYYVASIAASGLPGALCPAILYMILISLGMGRTQSLLAGMASFFCTNLMYWSTLLFSHSLSTALFLAGILMLFRSRNWWQYMLAGFLAGMSVSSDYYMLLTLPILGIWCWRIRGWRCAAIMAAGGVVAGLFPAIYHALIFGSPFVLPYKYAAHFSYVHEQGLYGAGVPRLSAAIDILFGSRFGMFLFNPVLLLGIPGAWYLWRRDRWSFYLFGGAFFVLLVLTSGHLDPYYGFGSSWGPRYLVPVFFVFLVAAAHVPDSPLSRRACTLLGVSSLVANVAFIMTYYPPPRGEGLRHLLEGMVPVMQRYGGMSTLGQALAVNTTYAPQLVLALNLLVILGALYIGFSQFKHLAASAKPAADA